MELTPTQKTNNTLHNLKQSLAYLDALLSGPITLQKALLANRYLSSACTTASPSAFGCFYLVPFNSKSEKGNLILLKFECAQHLKNLGKYLRTYRDTWGPEYYEEDFEHLFKILEFLEVAKEALES